MALLERQLADRGTDAEGVPPAGAASTPQALSPADVRSLGHGAASYPGNPSMESLTTGASHAARAAAESVIKLSDLASGPEPDYSKVFLASIMSNMADPQLHRRSRMPVAPTEGDHAPLSDIMGGMQDAFPVTLPSQEAVEYLTKVYFRLTDIGLPLLHKSVLQSKLDVLQNLPPTIDLSRTHTTAEARMATFFVFEVLAMALLIVQEQQPSGRWLAEQYHKTALTALSEAGLPSNVEGVQALLLLGQHAYHHPTLRNAWKVIGSAVRLAIELGLHRDQPQGETDFMELDNMRRTFWVAYAMDRNLSAALSLPCSLSDGAITAKVRDFRQRLTLCC